MGAEMRRLAAIMFTDIVGWVALTQKNEALALQLLEEHNRLLRPILSKHRGQEIKGTSESEGILRHSRFYSSLRAWAPKRKEDFYVSRTEQSCHPSIL